MNDDSNDKFDASAEMFGGFDPQHLDDVSWEIIRKIAKGYFDGGEKNYVKCSIMAYFDFIDIATENFNSH